MLLHAARRGTTASLVARQRATSAAAVPGPVAATRSLVSGTAGTQKKRPLNVGQLKGNKADPPSSEGGSGAAAAKTAPKPDPPVAAAAPTPAPDASVGAGAAKAAASGGSGGGSGLLVGLLGLGAAGVGAAYYYDMIDFGSLTGSPIKEEKKWEIIKQAKEDAEEAKMMEAIAEKEMEEAIDAAASAISTGVTSKDSETEDAAASAEVKTEEADAPADDPGADTSAGTESSESGTTAESGNRVTTIVVPPIDEENRPPQVVPANSEHPPNANKVTGLPFGGNSADADAAAGGDSGSAEESAQREHALVSAEEAAKEIASAAEGKTEAKLRAAHKSLRADLDESYLSDLDSLGERELRIRVVQLASEMDERTKWEAVRLKEFLSMKEKETAEK